MDIWIPQLTDSEVRAALQEHYDLGGITLNRLPSYGDQNFHIISGGMDYTLKIFSSRDDSSISVAQYSLFEELAKSKFPAPRIIKTVNGETHTWQRGMGLGDGGEQKAMRFASHLQTYLSGQPLSALDITDELCFKVGRFLGRFHVLLKDYKEPFYERYVSKYWSLTRLPELRALLDKLPEKDRPLLSEILNAFEQMKLEKEGTLPQGIVHGDPNQTNILISLNPALNNATPGYDVCGIFDFGETSYSCLLYDLAICVASFCSCVQDCQRWNVIGEVINGYNQEKPITGEEIDVLKISTCGRYAQLVINGYCHLTQDSNNKHVENTLSGLIHGDPNETNILINRNAVPNCAVPEENIYGLLDFGETSYSCYVYDVAICLANLCIFVRDYQRWNVIGKVLNGYNAVRPITREEFNVLKICICGSLAQLVINGNYHLMQDPNNEHVKITLKGTFPAMERMYNMNKESFASLADNFMPFGHSL